MPPGLGAASHLLPRSIPAHSHFINQNAYAICSQNRLLIASAAEYCGQQQETIMFRAIVFSLAFLVPQFVFAHHGGSEYELNKTVEFKGKLTRVDLINPHSWLYFDTTGADGTVSHH